MTLSLEWTPDDANPNRSYMVRRNNLPPLPDWANVPPGPSTGVWAPEGLLNLQRWRRAPARTAYCRHIAGGGSSGLTVGQCRLQIICRFAYYIGAL